LRYLSRSGSAQQSDWLDSDTLAVLKTGPGAEDKSQVYLYEGCTGDGWQVTELKTGVQAFLPFAGGIVFKARHPERDENKPRDDQYGKFTHFEQETSADALYYTHLEELRTYRTQLRLKTEDEAKALTPPLVELSRLLPEPLSIQQVVVSPLGEALYFACRRRDDMVYFRDVRLFALHLDAPAALRLDMQRKLDQKTQEKSGDSKPAEEGKDKPETPPEDLSHLGKLTELRIPPATNLSAVSPDGKTLLLSHQGRDNKMYTQSQYWTIPVQAALDAPDAAAFKAHMRCLTVDLDQDPVKAEWVPGGIFASYAESTHVGVARLSEQGRTAPIELGDLFPEYGFTASDGGALGFVGTGPASLPEACLATPAEDGSSYHVRKLTDFSAALQDWQLGVPETIRWTSRDGTEIEGVLYKPADFDPHKQYPLAFVVHGGPAGVSLETLLGYEDKMYYPTVQFVNQGVLVLKPNYRGSIGRGQSFLELNVNNLGVGDLWDLESAIDHLVGLGWVDPDKVGCMGWSQGGYISAFAGLHSQRFQAVSVGAGISDWYTYHISNDIPEFTTDYLSVSPFRDREIYAKTAPISNLANAKTPMLIQHGSDDRRVPVSNATELYRGLKEMGVPVELFIYPGMGHPITKPRQNHAVWRRTWPGLGITCWGRSLSCRNRLTAQAVCAPQDKVKNQPRIRRMDPNRRIFLIEMHRIRLIRLFGLN
jgi:dipeptidyl aminopeptidase/acylaminoacyl peptidase